MPLKTSKIKIKIKTMQKFERKLTKNSKYSYSISVPKEIVEKYGWRGKQRMTIVDKGRGIVEIKDWRRK